MQAHSRDCLLDAILRGDDGTKNYGTQLPTVAPWERKTADGCRGPALLGAAPFVDKAIEETTVDNPTSFHGPTFNVETQPRLTASSHAVQKSSKAGCGGSPALGATWLHGNTSGRPREAAAGNHKPAAAEAYQQQRLATPLPTDMTKLSLRQRMRNMGVDA